MVELADASDSKSDGSDTVSVRPRSAAPRRHKALFSGVCLTANTTFGALVPPFPTNLLLTQNLCGSPDIISPKKTLRLFLGVLLGRIWRAVALQQPPRLQRPPSRAVVPALGQETARTMRRFQARKRSKPHRGFDKKTLSRPFPKNLLLTQNLCGSPEIIPQKSFSSKNIFRSPDIIPPKNTLSFFGDPI